MKENDPGIRIYLREIGQIPLLEPELKRFNLRGASAGETKRRVNR